LVCGSTFYFCFPEQLSNATIGIAKYRKDGNRSTKTFFATHPGNNQEVSYNDTIKLLKQTLNLTIEIRKIDPEALGGIILKTNLGNFSDEIRAFREVFGPISQLQFVLGMEIPESVFNLNPRVLRKLSFIIIPIEFDLGNAAERSAETVLTKCNGISQLAISRNISAEILCRVKYPSEGSQTINGAVVTSTLGDFYRFWCTLVNQLNDGKYHARIIMRSAFDESRKAFPGMAQNGDPHSTEYHYGWWKRALQSSTEEVKLFEKIDCKSLYHRLKMVAGEYT